MLRAVLAGLLAISVVGCGSKDSTAQVQAGAAAGRVLEVTGAVTAVRGGSTPRAPRPLAVGDPVTVDDTIQTGSDGHVVIELAHNLARWDLGPNKHERVTDSMAWSLPRRQDTPAGANEDTVAAGRQAEKSAADTAATASSNRMADEEERQEPKQETAKAPASVDQAPPPKTEPEPQTGGVISAEAPGRTDMAKKTTSRPASVPPAPPPPPPAKPSPGRDYKPSVSRELAVGGNGGPVDRGGHAEVTDDGASGQNQAPGGAGASPGAAASVRDPAAAVRAQLDVGALAKCLAPDLASATLVVRVAASGKATFELTGGAKVPAPVKACIGRIVHAAKFPARAATAQIKLER